MSATRDAAPAENAPLLEVRGLEAGYGALQILFRIDLHVGAGERVLVFGPNGAGKSTLLKALVGLLPPDAGEVRLDGRPLADLPPERRVEAGLGYVPQVDNVFAGMTVEENLEMGAVTMAGSRGARRERLERTYESFPVLAERRRQVARTLSGGQRQLLAMARALMPEPRLLLLDEPSAGLAPSLVDEMFETVRRIGESGTAVLMVEQNAKQALGWVERGYVLDGGAVRFEDRAARLLERDDIGELYLGADPAGAEDPADAGEAGDPR